MSSPRNSSVATINAIPTASATGTTICVGNTISLTSSGGSTYSWVGPNSFVSTLQNPTISNGQTVNGGVYTVTVTSSAGCTATATASVVVNVIPSSPTSAGGSRCGAGTVSLSASGCAGGTISWYAGLTGGTSLATGASYTTPSISTTTTYYVECSLNGCVSSPRNSSVATINAIPTASATGTTICVGNTISLTSSGGGTYSWVGPNSFVSTLQNPTISNGQTVNGGVYTVTVTSSAGCTATATASVVVNVIPSSPTSAGGSRCGTGTVSLSASGCAGGTISWYAGLTGGTSLATGASYTTPSISTTTTYYVECSLNGCVSSPRNSSVATINTIPTASATGTTICVGNTISLTSSGGSTYSWVGPNSFVSTLQNPTISNGQTVNGGVYTVTVTSSAGCTATATASVVVNVIPSSPTSAGGSRCGAGTVSLSASGCAGGTISWYAGLTGGTSLATGASYTTPSISTTTTYYVECSLNGCVSSPRNSSVATINAIPNVVINGSAACVGNTISLTSSGGGTYSWVGPNSFVSTLQNPTISNGQTVNGGVYTVTVTSSAGCTASATINITVSVLPTASISGTTTICSGESTTLSATGGNYYLWSNGSSSAAITVSPTSNTSYTATVYQNSVTSTNLITNVANFNSSNFSYINSTNSFAGAAALFDNIDNTNVDTFHASRVTAGTDWGIGYNLGGSYLITNLSIDKRNDCCSSRAEGGVMQVWRNGAMVYQSNVLTGTGDILNASPTPNVIGEEVRYVFLSGANTSSGESVLNFAEWIIGGTKLCSTTAQTTVTVNPIPSSPTSAGGSRCGTGTVSLSASGCAGGTISWYTGLTGGTSLATGASYTTPSISTTTTYYVECSLNGCVSSPRNSSVATINTIPTATASSNTPILIGGTLNLFSTGGDTYSWSGPNAFTSTLNNVSTLPMTTSMAGTYTVTVNVNGCTATATTEVVVTTDDPGDIDCSVIPTLSFSSPTLISGTAGQVNAQYRFTNVTGGTDAIVTILSKSHADITIVDLDVPAATYGGYDAAMQPIIDYNWINGGGSFDAAGEKSVTFKIDFVDTGTTNAKVIPNLVASGLDLDGSGTEVREFIESSGYQSHQVQNPTSLTLSGALKAKGALTTYAGINELALDAVMSYGYVNKSSITITYGADWNGSTSDFADNANPTLSDERRLNSLYFKCYNLNNTFCDVTLAAPTGIPASRCGTGTVTLSASGCSGVYKWYTASTGGTALSQTVSYTTPSITTTTTYYVECNAVGCTSTRTAVIATINTIPSAPTVTSNSICGTGSVTLSASNCTGGTVTWFASQTGTTSLGTGSSFTATSLTASAVYFASCTSSNTCVSTTRNYGVATINPIPEANLAAINSLCIGFQPSNNGKLLLTKFKSSDLFSYNVGSTYNSGTASTFAAIPTNGEVLTSIADPTVNTTYTVRIKNTQNCTIDRSVTFSNQCSSCPSGYCEPASIVKMK
ncbi:hypothetical protein EMA8858_04195 [Emticicia aquatica]|uniref:Ig-like domain-containing protein n=1 Tax=Emticicia aquatica TaxID=1681835 RepID=A0ABN8F3V2_9BACT|nr:hypothetical protein EMA8858_04195 [Emticicia aquatica]